MMTTVQKPRSSARGFTLLELIISVALVLVLMLAITRIFSIAGTTIGASQGIAAAVRDARAAQAVLAKDFAAMAVDSPFIWLRYDPPRPAFRNALDAEGDHDYQPGTQTKATDDGGATVAQQQAKLTFDIDQNGVDGEAAVPGEVTLISGVPVSVSLAVNERSHRLDRFSFCARDRFYRQTGNGGDEFVSSMSSPEAWITYGHLALPRNDGQFILADSTGTLPAAAIRVATDPGLGTEQNNPDNFYASQWVLGRVAMLMVLPQNAPSANAASTPLATAEQIRNTDNTRQTYYARTLDKDWNDTSTAAGSDAADFSPLWSTTKAKNGATGTMATTALKTARYDLVGSDITNASKLIQHRLAWESAVANSSTALPWYSLFLSDRFQVNPFVSKPATPASVSQQVPMFLPACSQFIVEYAGDFVTQRENGALDNVSGNDGLRPDGKIDFYYDTATGQKRTQWFGYPRSYAGSNVVNAAIGDVVLFGDFVHYIASLTTGTQYNTYGALTTANAALNFEKFIYPAMTVDTARTDKAAFTLTTSRNTPPASSGGIAYSVYAAWDPTSINNPDAPRPKLYRITLTIDRPEMAGRSASGQTFEYVFNAP